MRALRQSLAVVGSTLTLMASVHAELPSAAGSLDQRQRERLSTPTKFDEQSLRGRAERAYQNGDWKAAGRDFAQLLDGATSKNVRAEALSGLAWINWKQGRLAESARRFEQFRSTFPRHHLAAHVDLAYAQTLVALGRDHDAVAVLSRFAGRHGRHPLVPQALFELGRLLCQQGEFAEAATVVDAVAAWSAGHAPRDGDSTPCTPDGSSSESAVPPDVALYLAGSIRQCLGQSPRAAFQQLADRFPKSPYRIDAVYRLAEDDAQAGDMGRARRRLARIINADGGDGSERVLPHALYLDARLAAGQRQWDDAARRFERLWHDFPGHQLAALARLGVAECRFQQGRHGEANSILDALLDQQGEAAATAAWAPLARLRKAQVLAAERRWLEAIAAAESIGDQFPDFPLQHEVDYSLGRSYAARGAFATARKYFRRVADSPSAAGNEIAAKASWMIGETYFHQGGYREAIDAYAALERHGPYPQWQAAALLETAKCQEQLGRWPAARQSYSQIINDFPATRYVTEATQRLQTLEQ